MSGIVSYPGKGCIVEYMEGNAPQIALVTEEQNGKLRLLLPNRREVRLTVNRLLPWSGPVVDVSGKDAAAQILEQHKTRRDSHAASINMTELWEMAQGEVAYASAQWFAELYEADPDVDIIAAYGRALLSCKSHFKFQPPAFEVYAAATVTQRLQEQEAAREREALVAGGAAFFRILWEVHNKKRTLPVSGSKEYPDDAVKQRLQELLLQRIADPETQENEALWRILVKGLPDVQHIPLLLATAWGLVPPHYNFWLDRADYAAADTWSAPFAAEIEALITQSNNAALPSVALPFISIDSATTQDVDDAFYVETRDDGSMCLHLALACPALVWPFDSALDKLVGRRVTSLYLPEGTYHMLPEVLGTQAFSLLAGQLRPALLFSCDISPAGEVLSCTPHIGRVCLAANLAYEDCEAVLHGSDETPASAYREQLAAGHRLAECRQALRIATGAVIMDRPDPKITLSGEGSAVKVHLEEAPVMLQSQRIVAEMMILASAACATWALEREVPLLFRTQDVVLPREYAGVWTEPHDMARIIRALASSSLESVPRPHAGLGVQAYSPVTSPLRRYPDLINEAQIISFLREGVPRLSADALETLRVSLCIRLDVVGQVQRFRPRYWKLLYIRQQGDKTWWDGVVTEENDAFCSVALPREQLFVRGRRQLFGERACPGQYVQVRLGKIHPLYNEISILEVVDV